MISGLLTNDTYLYDDPSHPNRLTSVNGITYTWDNNGNLLNDGVNTYAYDAANRLKTLTGATTANFAYNGLGDRLSQNGVNYTLDLNAGLTQVLNDGMNNSVYGVDRIAQTNGTNTEFFLGDALGSVRQLANTNGTVTLTKSYAPYGNVAQSAGSAQTTYGFTGEFTDPSGMVYLRARYYAPGMGRFITRDTWGGDYQNPLSLNRWNYTSSNPINYTDPSGNFGISCGQISPIFPCFRIVVVEEQWYPGGPILPTLKLVPCDTQAQQQPLVNTTPTATPQPFTPTPAQQPLTPTPQSGTPTPQASKALGRDLTPDERRHIQRIYNVNIDLFISKHPWALTEPSNGPHYVEALQLESRLITSTSVLVLAYPHLHDEAKTEARAAISDATSKLVRLQTWLSARADYRPRPIPR